MQCQAADLIRGARERRGLTQRRLALRAGTSQDAISRIERGVAVQVHGHRRTTKDLDIVPAPDGPTSVASGPSGPAQGISRLTASVADVRVGSKGPAT